jgi:hypothetical protein
MACSKRNECKQDRHVTFDDMATDMATMATAAPVDEDITEDINFRKMIENYEMPDSVSQEDQDKFYRSIRSRFQFIIWKFSSDSSQFYKRCAIKTKLDSGELNFDALNLVYGRVKSINLTINS